MTCIQNGNMYNPNKITFSRLSHKTVLIKKKACLRNFVLKNDHNIEIKYVYDYKQFL